jgi:uncharacterized protein YqeY
MSLKEKIEKDFITAFKSKDINAKAALSSIKAAITVAEKANPSWVATDDEVIKIVNKGIRQREESINMYELACRDELVRKEADEICVLRSYMPTQMTETEIESEVKIIMSVIDAGGNRNKLIGQTMGTFNKKFQGRADSSAVMNIIEKLA